MTKKAKEDLLIRLDMHIMFLQIFVRIKKEILDISEINCFEDTINNLIECKNVIERL